MQSGVAIYALGEELGREEAKIYATVLMHTKFFSASLLWEVPGGNLVDGLPPAASTGAGLISRPFTAVIALGCRCFAGVVINRILYDFNRSGAQL